MPNILDENGLQLYTRAELVTKLEDGFKTIYGNDINVDSDSPDGQMINLLVQIMQDYGDLLLQVYNSFDPDNAIGRTLDRRVSFNGVQRQGGTFSRTNVSVTVSQTVTLYGLDQTANTVFKVSDDQGNEWELLETITISTGTHALEFQSTESGEVLTTLNTITSVVTIVLGVDSVTNPNAQTLIGTDIESDTDLKVRRRKSVSLASRGFLESMIAELENVEGVTSVSVYENNSGVTDADGIPSHSMWAILAGNFTDEDVANAIYRKRDGGLGMKGDESYIITQVDGSPFEIKWDEVGTEEVFVEVNLESIDGTIIDYAGIRSSIPSQYLPDVFETVNTNRLAEIVNGVDGNALITSSGFSTVLAGPYESKLTPDSKKKQFIFVEEKVVLLPILLKPSAQTVANGAQIQFSALGGYGNYTYSLQVNNSGATLNTSTGLYDAGGSDGDDTIRVTDDDGNFTEVIITVA